MSLAPSLFITHLPEFKKKKSLPNLTVCYPAVRFYVGELWNFQTKTQFFLELKGKKNNYAKQLLVFRGRRQVSGNQTNNKFWKFPKEWGFLTPEQGQAATPGGGALLLFPKDLGRGSGGVGWRVPRRRPVSSRAELCPVLFPPGSLG